MDISKLIEQVSAPDQVKLKVLHNAVINTTKSYKDDPTKSRLADWHAAQSALDDTVDMLTTNLSKKTESDQQSDMPSWSDYTDTASKAAVLRHLQGMGYDITQRTFYRHCEQGKLHKSTGNIYTIRLVQQYVKAVGLYRPGAAPGEGSNIDDLATDKLKKEIKKLDEAGRREELKRKKEEGLLIEREALYLELAARAVALDTGFRQMITVEATALIAAVKGDINRQREFEDMMLQAWNQLLDSYATKDEFEVLFEDDNTTMEGF